MKRTASVVKKSNARGTSTRARSRAARFAVCIKNTGYEASLERNKIYVVIPDEDAEREGDLRVVDESGEDYLFAADRLESPSAMGEAPRRFAGPSDSEASTIAHRNPPA
jgi:hypothetical protein